MGVETAIPPRVINAAAPDGALPRRIENGVIIICRFSWFEYEAISSYLTSRTEKSKIFNKEIFLKTAGTMPVFVMREKRVDLTALQPGQRLLS